MSTVITSIDHRSPAERAGVRTGERLISIGGHAVEDVLDYRFFGYEIGRASCRERVLSHV